MNDFEYDVMEKKRIARMAKYRRNGSKSKKCPMSTDHMTRKQWEERCGELHTYNMNEPKSWDQFKEMPIHIQREYLEYLVKNYNVNATSLGMMFSVRPLTVRRHIEANKLGITFKVGNSMNTKQKNEWLRFLDGVAEPEETDGTECEAKEQQQHINCMDSMNMKRFSLTFEGKIDVNMIANSIVSIAGQNAVGTVEIICTF